MRLLVRARCTVDVKLDVLATENTAFIERNPEQFVMSAVATGAAGPFEPQAADNSSRPVRSARTVSSAR